MSKPKVLIIEDEEDIVELVSYNLENEGFTVCSVESGDLAVETVLRFKPDLILLDLMLPGMNGLDVCRTLKGEAETRSIPIIMLTAKGEETDIVLGLEMGADDYIPKPFSPRVLIARIRSVLRRGSSTPLKQGSVLSIDGLMINPGKHIVSIDDTELNLTATEFNVLYFLARNRGWVYTRYQIVEGVHGDDYPVTDRSVDVQITGLRKKLGSYGEYIETVRGVGYRFRE